MMLDAIAADLVKSIQAQLDRLKAGVGWLPPEWMDEEGVRRNVRTLGQPAARAAR